MTVQNAIIIANANYRTLYADNPPEGLMGAIFRAIPKKQSKDSFWDTWEGFQNLTYGQINSAFEICNTIIKEQGSIETD